MDVQSDQGADVQSQDQGGGVQSTDQGGQLNVKVGAKVYNDVNDLVKDYERLQAQHTKVTQAISAGNSNEQPMTELDDVDQVINALEPKLVERLKAKGMVTKEEMEFATFVSQNPDVDAEKLKKLAQHPDYAQKAYSDIVEEWGLRTGKKFYSDPKGQMHSASSAPVSIKDMSDEQYEKWRAQNVKLPSYRK